MSACMQLTESNKRNREPCRPEGKQECDRVPMAVPRTVRREGEEESESQVTRQSITNAFIVVTFRQKHNANKEPRTSNRAKLVYTCKNATAQTMQQQTTDMYM